jgi:hypothetical protein
MGMEWQNGSIPGVFFATINAAISAAAIASPFSSFPDRKRAIVETFNLISPSAHASLVMTSFAEMSTIEKRRILVESPFNVLRLLRGSGICV